MYEVSGCMFVMKNNWLNLFEVSLNLVNILSSNIRKPISIIIILVFMIVVQRQEVTWHKSACVCCGMRKSWGEHLKIMHEDCRHPLGAIKRTWRVQYVAYICKWENVSAVFYRYVDSCVELWWFVRVASEHHYYSLIDHMYIEEYVEEDEEPPLLLSSRPSHGKYTLLCVQKVGRLDLAGLCDPWWCSAGVFCRCLAVVGLQRCSVGGRKGVCVRYVLQVRSLRRWEDKSPTSVTSSFSLIFTNVSFLPALRTKPQSRRGSAMPFMRNWNLFRLARLWTLPSAHFLQDQRPTCCDPWQCDLGCRLRRLSAWVGRTKYCPRTWLLFCFRKENTHTLHHSPQQAGATVTGGKTTSSTRSTSLIIIYIFPSVGFTHPPQKILPSKAPVWNVSLLPVSVILRGDKPIRQVWPFGLISVFSASLHVRTVRTVGKGPSSGSGSPVNGTVVRSAEEKTAEYAVFALVPIFCVMGLLGILICNILKKKGYRCSAEKEGGDEETATPQKEGEGLSG